MVDEGLKVQNRTKKIVLATICAAFLAFFCCPVFSQAGIDTGSVTGTVKDSTGAVVAGAKCTLTNVATGVAQTAVSTSAGAYTFPTVAVGTYSLNVTARGFKVDVINGIVVHLGTTVTEDVPLQVGAADVQVTVTPATPLLQAQDASLGMTIDDTMVNNLPIFTGTRGRSFTDLLSTAPGVSSANNQIINGVATGQVDYRLNGADDDAEVFGGITIPPIPDTIQEFKLEDGNNSAELGHSTGAVVNVITKSGTNQFKGEVWEYNGNNFFNANDYFNKRNQLYFDNPAQPNKPPVYKVNSYGGLFGGPVRLPHYNGKNRTFFFVDYQRTQFTQTASYTGTVPTANMQNSGFQDLSDTLTLNYQKAGGKPANSEVTDGLGRSFQRGTMLDPATTRAVPCGSVDPITGLPTDCTLTSVPKGVLGVVSDPNIDGGAKVAIIRDPYFGPAPSGCPSLMGTTDWNSTHNQGSVSPSCLNQLPSGRLDPNAIALLKLFPGANQNTPGTLSYGNNYHILASRPSPTTQYDIRVDENISSKDSAYATYSHYNFVDPGFAPLPGILEGGGNVVFNSAVPSHMIVVTETHVFSPSLINEFRFGREDQYNSRYEPGSIGGTNNIPAKYGIQGIPVGPGQDPPNGGLPTFNSIGSGISQFGSRVNITVQDVGAWEYSDNLTKIKGKHELQVGGQFDWTYGNIAQLPYTRGDFSYGGFSNVPYSGDGNSGMADFLLVPSAAAPTYTAAGGLSQPGNLIGGVSGYHGSGYSRSTYHAPYLAFYVQDKYKVTPSLTLSLGLRYEYFGPYYSDGGQEGNLWLGGNGNSANGAAYYVAHDGCASSMAPSFKALLAYDNIPIICQPKNAANEMPMANWGPRLGIAYRIRPNLVARIGAGASYGAFQSEGYGGTLATNYPFTFIINSPANNNAYTALTLPDGSTATMENTFAQIAITNAANASFPLGTVRLTGRQYHYKVPYITTLTFALQWQFSMHDSIQAIYVGNLGKDLDNAGPYFNAVSELLTPSTPVVTLSPTATNPFAATGYVPFPNLGPNIGPTVFSNQVSNYESGVLDYVHQFGGGYSMDANYTYSRCLSDQEAEGLSPNIRAPWVTGFGGMRSDYDRCNNEADQVFHFSGDYALPFGRGARWASSASTLEDEFIGGWHLDWLAQASSGVPSNVGCDTAKTGPLFAANTALACNAPTVAGQHLYGPGPNDLARTKTTGFLNSSAFYTPDPVQQNGQLDFSPLGTRANQIMGPSWYNIDTSFHKTFNAGEHAQLAIGVQAINVLNHTELSNPGTGSYTNPSAETIRGGFGVITGDRHSPRQMQFFGKFFF